MELSFEGVESSVLDQLNASPVPDLLADTRAVPTPTQSLLISEHLSSLSNLLDQIQDFVCRSTALETQLRAAQQLHLGLNSAVRMLPVEILSEIFCVVQAAEPGFRQMSTARLVSSVCRQWRHAALSCGALWSSLHVVVSASKRRISSGQLECIRESLSRSKEHPLHITLSWVSPEESILPPVTETALALIVKERRRWLSLNLILRNDAVLPPFVHMDPEDAGPLPLLQQLDISGGHPVGPMVPSEYPLFAQAPCLSYVTIIAAPRPSLIPHSWQNILIFKTSDTLALLTALTSCPVLRTAKREEDVVPANAAQLRDAFPDGKILHSRLQKLRLCFGTCRNDVLNLLSLPALETLALQDYERKDQELLGVLPAFLAPSIRLRSLTLELQLDVDDLPLFTNILCDCLPVLEDLHLKEDNPPLSLITVESPFSLISCLLASPTSRPVPLLETLEYHMYIDDWAEYNTGQGESAIFCMICLAALEKITEEVISSRFEQSDADHADAGGGSGMKALTDLYVCVDKIKGLERPAPFFGGLEKFVSERKLGLKIQFRETGAHGDPLFDDDGSD